MVWISPTFLIVEYGLRSAWRDRVTIDCSLRQPHDAGSNQRERKRVFLDFAGKVAGELGWQTLVRSLRTGRLAGPAPFSAQLFEYFG